MDSSGADLDKIEAQRSTDVSHNQLLRQRAFPMNLINNSSHDECTTPATGDTRFMPEFFTDLRLSGVFELPGDYLPMNSEMFGALSNGDKDFLEKLGSHEMPIACLRSHWGDSALHLVAAWGHLEGVMSIVFEFPCLLLEPNSKDQLPIHVAARAGHLDVVEALVATLNFVSTKLYEEDTERLNIYVVKDANGDTPLHLALKGDNLKVALCLVSANRKASFLANKDGISPLYLAVEADDVFLVKAMLRNENPQGRNSNSHSKLEGRKYLVHAALELRNTDILDVILNEYPSLVDERDEEGRTCLSFGASIGFYKGVCKLLDRSTSSVFECNDDGSFPIHVAVEKGNLEVIDEILERCPNSKHMLNKKGQNILHIAANSGKFKILLELLKSKRAMDLVDEQDMDGNTPLHLATIKWRPRVAYFLAGEKNVLIQNNNGLKALDSAMLNVQPQYIFRERLTLVVLAVSYVRKNRRLPKRTIPSLSMDRGENKDFINALLLVAALIATVTFAAAFTLPGSYISSNPNLGMANLASDPRLICFLIFDMLAMHESIIAVVSLVWAQLGDPALRQSSIVRAWKNLFAGLQYMGLVFLFGLIIAAGNVTGLVIFFSITSFCFLLMIFLQVAPHVALQRAQLKLLQRRINRFAWHIHIVFIFAFLCDDEDEKNHSSAHKSVKQAESVEILHNDHVETPDAT